MIRPQLLLPSRHQHDGQLSLPWSPGLAPVAPGVQLPTPPLPCTLLFIRQVSIPRPLLSGVRTCFFLGICSKAVPTHHLSLSHITRLVFLYLSLPGITLIVSAFNCLTTQQNGSWKLRVNNAFVNLTSNVSHMKGPGTEKATDVHRQRNWKPCMHPASHLGGCRVTSFPSLLVADPVLTWKALILGNVSAPVIL